MQYFPQSYNIEITKHCQAFFFVKYVRTNETNARRETNDIRISSISLNSFLKLTSTSTLPLGSKTDYKRDIDKDNLTCLALFKCKASNHFVCVVTSITKINYVH